ncbi:thiol reductant ABC exporter subunit CydD [Bordetella sp. 02P26C-1]|uniref:thiol reductant ABC exporter subunit CydD n=1 Tax=Bordetella sp. 02P26C-1 TaxID=2683195 RepID=UPI0013552D71|nr:thiol reductant ABC exporter subunit CydD [Bordetella sp. 02P26C-1]MVW79218.1 thiol reductant ABC exporter subunit CydD [Bordetella sp. 02P26C-1]
MKASVIAAVTAPTTDAATDADPAVVGGALPREHTRWLSAQARIPRAALTLAVAAPLVGGVLLLVQAWLLARVLDAAIMGDAPRAALMGDIGIIVALIAVRALLTWVSERAGARAAEGVKQTIRLALFDRMMALGPTWTRSRVSGELASAVVDQVEGLDGFFARYLPSAVSAAILPLAFGLVLLPSDWIAGLLLLVTAPLIPMFMALIGWGAEAASRRHVRAMARLSGFFADRLRGLATLKLYGRAQAEAALVGSASEAIRQRTMSVLRIAFLSSAVLEFFAALGVAGMAVYFGLTYLGFLDLRASPLTLHAGFFCLLMAPEAYAPLRQFAAHYHDRATARAAVAQIAQAFEGLPDTQGGEGAPNQGKRTGVGQATVAAGNVGRRTSHDISQGASHEMVSSRTAMPAATPRHETPAAGMTLRLQALTIHTPDRTRPVLQAAELAMSAGEHVVLMGESGSGKTTLLEALTRMRSSEGHIELDGVVLADWDEAALRERVALIGQKPFLFAGSIADNIRLGRPAATDDEVLEAARRAQVLAFADALPAGLATLLGPRGRGLSGGQAQRVALARLFLRDPALILLDEPTAHLDEATQAQVLEAILDFAQGRTLILATHASSVAQRLARVVRLVDGKLEAA